MTNIDEKDLEKVAGGVDISLKEMYDNMDFALTYAEKLMDKYSGEAYYDEVKYIRYEIMFGMNFYNNGNYEAAKEKARHNWQYMRNNKDHSDDDYVQRFMKYLRLAAECAG